MTEEIAGKDGRQADLFQGLDLWAARTWLVFAAFALGLGVTSGLIMVASELLGAMVFTPLRTKLNLVAQLLSVGLHCVVIYLLIRMIPKRNAEGDVVHDSRDPGYAEMGLKALWLLLPWGSTICVVAVLVMNWQPYFELPPSAEYQYWLPILFIFSGARFPACVVLARSRKREDRAGHKDSP